MKTMIFNRCHVYCTCKGGNISSRIVCIAEVILKFLSAYDAFILITDF